mmetsp:Transcript_57165/g.164173  ORF Transcript_57165/g.164173 Transcript_57165/m.164173 type:complete len:281 (-) Transcript_57165:40-882(-)
MEGQGVSRSPLVARCVAAAAVLVAAAVLATAAGASLGEAQVELTAAGRRLSTSTKCRQGLEAMLTNEHWNFMNLTYTKWCRIKAENEMARCCGVADFEQGRGEDCQMTRMSGTAQPTECFASCQHGGMATLCATSFGKSCSVDRKLFQSVDFKVSETFCVPEACDNSNDRENLMNWYATLYAGRLNGWHARWDDATLNCPSAAIAATLYMLAAIVLTPVALGVLWFLLVAPKERGRMLKSQEEMQAESMAEADAQAMGDLRGTAQMSGDRMAQSGMSRSR